MSRTELAVGPKSTKARLHIADGAPSPARPLPHSLGRRTLGRVLEAALYSGEKSRHRHKQRHRRYTRRCRNSGERGGGDLGECMKIQDFLDFVLIFCVLLGHFISWRCAQTHVRLSIWPDSQLRLRSEARAQDTSRRLFLKMQGASLKMYPASERRKSGFCLDAGDRSPTLCEPLSVSSHAQGAAVQMGSQGHGGWGSLNPNPPNPKPSRREA